MVCDAETSRRNGAKSKGAETERGKAIASRNATKHGLLAQKPPILASEDLETFQGLMQGLVDQYEPSNPLEWHYVQTIAMCIQRQHRVWAAEAAVGNESLLAPLPKPYTDEKYSTEKSISFDFGKTEFHPDNLRLERKLLTNFLEQYPSDNFPSRLRAKYWTSIWEEWRDSVEKSIKELLANYPSIGLNIVVMKRFIVLFGNQISKITLTVKASFSCRLSKMIAQLQSIR